MFYVLLGENWLLCFKGTVGLQDLMLDRCIGISYHYKAISNKRLLYITLNHHCKKKKYWWFNLQKV